MLHIFFIHFSIWAQSPAVFLLKPHLHASLFSLQWHQGSLLKVTASGVLLVHLRVCVCVSLDVVSNPTSPKGLLGFFSPPFTQGFFASEPCHPSLCPPCHPWLSRGLAASVVAVIPQPKWQGTEALRPPRPAASPATHSPVYTLPQHSVMCVCMCIVRIMLLTLLLTGWFYWQWPLCGCLSILIWTHLSRYWHAALTLDMLNAHWLKT